MNRTDAQKRILAARAMLLEPTTTRQKFSSIRTLVHGFNPKLDEALRQADQHLSTVEKLVEGEVIELTAEHLPENTEDEKKRKRALLLFIKSWNDLKGEVGRVQQELYSEQGEVGQPSTWGRIFGFAKGPFGIITILALGVALVMQQTSITFTIQNEGCGTMVVAGSIPFPLPGFSLPSEPIPSGGSGTAVLPPLTVSVDGTLESVLTLSALAFSASFELPNNIQEVTLNNVSLLNQRQDIHLSGQKQHTLVLRCQ